MGGIHIGPVWLGSDPFFGHVMNREIFLDNNATTQPLPEVTAAVVAAMSAGFGNASSANRAGERARRVLRDSRESIARLIGATGATGSTSDSISFTSGATEANNWVLQRICHQPGNHLVTTQTEHSSIKSLGEFLERSGVQVERLPVDECGRVRVDQLAKAIRRQTTLVSVHWVNNETGTVQPVEEIAAICRERGVLFHTDASQAVGKLSVDVANLDCDFLSFSAHKFHGPQGVGGLYIRPGVKLTPLLFEGVNGEALVARLDQRGILCSQSSACTNQRPEPSYVLRAMGLSELQAYASVRFSVSVLNSDEEIDESVHRHATALAWHQSRNRATCRSHSPVQPASSPVRLSGQQSLRCVGRCKAA